MSRRVNMATKTVFTIGRQFGSGGRIIGKMLAKQLGIPFYDKELLTEAAKESGISEELFESLDEKPASNFLYAMVMGNYAYSQAGTGAGMTINDRLVQAQTKAIEDIASKGGAVIVGRCADYVLRDHPRTVNVFIHAPLNERAQRAAIDYGMTERNVTDAIKKIDKKRSSYYNFYTDKNWNAVDSYELALSSSMGFDKVVKLIIDYANAKFADEDDE